MIKKTITEDKNIFIILILYAFLLIFFCSKMSPLYPYNGWSDVNLYFNMGKALFNGKTIYTEVFDHKGPLIFFIYGIGYLISNTSFLGMYFIESLFWAVMLCTVYLTARLYVDKVYALVIALAYSVFALSHTGEGGAAEEFILVFETISLFFFIRYFKNKEASSHSPKIMLMHGILCAMTFFIKLNLILFWFFPLLAIFVNLIMKKEYRNLLKNILAFIIGFFIITLPVCIYFIVNDALSEAWYVYIELNRSYAKIGGFIQTLELLAVRFYLRLRFESLQFILILIGAVYFPYKYINNKVGAVSIILSFLALYTIIFITPGYVHYYAIPYSVFVCLSLIVLSKYVILGKSKLVYIAAFILFLFAGINQKSFFGLQITQIIKRETNGTYVDKFEAVIAKEKNPTLMNLGLDLGNYLFTRLNIMPSVKYFISPNLRYDIYPDMWDAQVQYIKDKEVQFILLVAGTDEYEYFSKLPALNENYVVVCTALDEESKVHYLYKRKD